MSNMRSKTKIPPSGIILIVLLIASLVFGGYYFREYNELKSQSTKTTEQLNQELVDRASKVYELPQDETPEVAIVAKDPKEFTEEEKQSLGAFKNLEKGDAILLYKKAGRAIQYRDRTNKVIDAVSYTVVEGVAIHIIGSEQLQNNTEATLKQAFSDKIRISGKSTPAGNYTSTTVADLSGQNTELAGQVAEALGGTVVSKLPSGEKAPEGAEIVVVMAGAQQPSADQ